MTETPDTTLRDTLAAARHNSLLRINPHFYYDQDGRYDMTSMVIPRGRWITLELGVRSFGWTEVEKSPDVQRMLAEVPRAACDYVHEAVIQVAHSDEPK